MLSTVGTRRYSLVNMMFDSRIVRRAPLAPDMSAGSAVSTFLPSERVRKEVFKGTEIKGAHRSGSEGAALAVLSYAVLSYSLYAYDTNVFTGALLGEPRGGRPGFGSLEGWLVMGRGLDTGRGPSVDPAVKVVSVRLHLDYNIS